jgi:uncharacterized membrane protein
MNGKVARRLLLIVVAVVIVAAVGALAYNAGLNMNGGGTRFGYGPMRMYDGYGWPGFGLFGFLVMLALGVLVVWFIFAVVPGPGGSRAPDPTASADVAKLRELTELHDRGALSDEEFTAAKRKLLGL